MSEGRTIKAADLPSLNNALKSFDGIQLNDTVVFDLPAVKLLDDLGVVADQNEIIFEHALKIGANATFTKYEEDPDRVYEIGFPPLNRMGMLIRNQMLSSKMHLNTIFNTAHAKCTRYTNQYQILDGNGTLNTKTKDILSMRINVCKTISDTIGEGLHLLLN